MKNPYPQSTRFNLKTLFRNLHLSLTVILFLISYQSAKSCSPLAVPSLTSWNITGTNLNLQWSSNTTYNCTYSIQVEIACASTGFSGTGPFYVTVGINKTTTPYAYPLQTINIASLCPGTTYQFRAREQYGAATFSAWTSITNFTTPGVASIPTISVTSSQSSICPPQTTQLTAQVLNGCGTPPFSFTWTPATGLSCTTCSNPIASPTVTTTYTVSTKGGPLGCWTASNTIQVVVSTIPPVVGVISATPTVLCAGNSATVSMSSYTGTIQWQSGPSSSGPFTNIAGATASVVTSPTLSANTCFKAVVTGCGTTLNSNTVCVTVNPNPTVTVNSATICAGSTANLTANGATSYAWSAGATSTGVNTANASPATTTSYTVTGTTAGCTGTAVSTVSVNPMPVPTATNNSPVCQGGALNLGAGGGGTYQWSGPNSFNSTLQNPSIASTTTLDAGVYTVTVNLNGCISSAATTVTVTVPTTSASNTGPYCEGATIQLNCPAAISYTWTGPGGFTSNLQNPTLPATSSTLTGVYTLLASVGGCNASATTSVLVNPLPVPVATNNSPVCENQPTNFTGSGGTTYTWTGPGSFNTNTQNPSFPFSQPSQSGLYTLTVKDANGCVNSTTVNLLVNPLPVITVNNPVLCENSAINLGATGGTGYQWSGPLGYTSTSQNPSIPGGTPSMSGIYNVTVTTAAGCTNTAFSNVLVNPAPVPNIITNSPICVNNVLMLSGTGGVSYNWSGPNGFFSTAQSPTVNANTTNYTGTYNLTVTDANGCTASTGSPVIINPIPDISIAASPNGGCPPLCTTFNVNSSSNVATYNWNLGNGMTGNTPNQQTCYNTTGIYTITAQVIDVNGCPNSTTHTVEVYPKPVADFNHAPIKPIINIDPQVTFTDASHNATITNWSWFFMNTAQYTSTQQNPTFMYTEPGHYVVALVVKSDKGCVDTILRPIEVGEDFGIYAPNAFTPNNDGLNDIFQPKGFGIVKYQLQIFDRWGERVYETKEFEKGWDGKFAGRGGEICEEGTYTWLINAVSVFGKAHELKGHVTLIK